MALTLWDAAGDEQLTQLPVDLAWNQDGKPGPYDSTRESSGHVTSAKPQRRGFPCSSTSSVARGSTNMLRMTFFTTTQQLTNFDCEDETQMSDFVVGTETWNVT